MVKKIWKHFEKKTPQKKNFIVKKRVNFNNKWLRKKSFYPSKKLSFKRRRMLFPRKEYIPFTYYAKKILRWKKIFRKRRNSRLLNERVKTPFYKWKHFWRKRKIRKGLKFWHNFSFFLKKQKHANVLKFNIRRKWVGHRKKKYFKFPRRRPRKMLSLRSSDTFKKKIYFKKFLIRHYNFRKVYQLKNLYICAKKIPGHHIINFFLSLESQLSSICVRMRFFWTLKVARIWIVGKTTYVNGRLIRFPRYITKIGDLITVLISFRLWSKVYAYWHKKYQGLLRNKYKNSCELSYKCASAIIFFLPYKIEDIKLILKKRKKTWLKTRIFSFLLNSFH